MFILCCQIKNGQKQFCALLLPEFKMVCKVEEVTYNIKYLAIELSLNIQLNISIQNFVMNIKDLKIQRVADFLL